MSDDLIDSSPLAFSTSLIDNGQLRVTRFVFPPGHTTGFHTHAFDYLVIPLTTGQLDVTLTDTPGPVTLTAGEPYFRRAGISHCLTNRTDQEVSFIEVEILSTD